MVEPNRLNLPSTQQSETGPTQSSLPTSAPDDSEITEQARLIGILQARLEQAEKDKWALALEKEVLTARLLRLEQAQAGPRLAPTWRVGRLELQNLSATTASLVKRLRAQSLLPVSLTGRGRVSVGDPVPALLSPADTQTAPVKSALVTNLPEPPPEAETSSPVSGAIDTPGANAFIKSFLLAVEGWAYSTASRILKIEVFLDEEWIGRATCGFERSDVAAYFATPAMVNCGYGGKFALKPSTAPGPKILRVTIFDDAGNQQELTRSVVLEKPAIEMSLDEPVMGAQTAGIITVSGWAFSWTTSISSIQAWLAGQFIGTIHHGIIRQDVADNTGYPGAERSGFWGILTFLPEASGKELLTIRAVDTLHNSVDISVEISLKLADEPVADIEKISWQGGLLHLEGWALWPVSQPPRLARLFVAGQFIDQVPINRARPDIQRRFPTNPLAARCGFQIDVPLIPANLKEKNLKDGDSNARADFQTVLLEFVDGAGRYLQQKSHVRYEHSPHQILYPERWQQFIEEYKDRFGQTPAILDWTGGLDLATLLPDQNIFQAAPFASRTLPYIDQSIDMVIIAEDEPERLAEAARVAVKGVISLAVPSKEVVSEEVAALEGVPVGLNHFSIQWRAQEPAITTRLPSSSIIIPTYNRADLVNNCLEHLIATLPSWLKVEIIVVDDASRDETGPVLESWVTRDERVRVLTNSENKGFLHTCNLGAVAASGEVLVFLNNDTHPRPGWLSPLLRTLVEHPEAGAVGGKLIYPNNVLQEAGAIIFADATGWNFGRGSYDLEAPLYNYLRAVDYCSGALLATRRALFQELGGFDTRFAPMYYEDVDYCFALRQKGYKVYYQPESVIVHLEGGTAGTNLSQGFKTWQVVNQAKFREKWDTALRRQPPHPLELNYDLALELVVCGDEEMEAEPDAGRREQDLTIKGF